MPFTGALAIQSCWKSSNTVSNVSNRSRTKGARNRAIFQVFESRINQKVADLVTNS